MLISFFLVLIAYKISWVIYRQSCPVVIVYSSHTPPNGLEWHKAFLRWVHSQGRRLQKYLRLRRHSTKKGRFRHQSMNLTLTERIKAWGDSFLRLEECRSHHPWHEYGLTGTRVWRPWPTYQDHVTKSHEPFLQQEARPARDLNYEARTSQSR